ncbi:MAG TPA: FAD-dependent oxidoreductase [Acidobacteriaceae bacterium]|jgi:thioredoxin reductase (NADPH)|nr:FAD-dependent oxidoreductase [Acidobacteriaceae bacterium]
MFTPQELQQAEIFACLDEAECARLAQTAADVRLEPGEWLIREGEMPWFYVLLEGRLRIVKDILGRQTEFAEYDFTEGDFLGEIPLLLGTPAFSSARAQTSCRIARLNKQQFQHLIRDSKEASALIVQTLNERIMRVQRTSITLSASRVLIFGRNRDTDCHNIRAFLSANRIPYEWVDRDRQPERLPAGVSNEHDCPAVSVDGQLFIEPPTTREVAEALQLQTAPKRDSYDVVIVGAGPAGMAAGVYGASEGLTVLVAERCSAGGQAGTSSRIENYLGFPEGVSGEDLTGRGFKQATRFGAEVALTRSLEKLTPCSEGYLCELDGGETVSARAVVLATGVDWRRLNAKGEDRLLGRGIFYGAARQEATNVVGKKIFIVGGGNSAGQAAMFLSSYAAEVKVVVRGEGLKLSMSQYLIDQIASKANIEVLPYTQVVSADGEDRLERIEARVKAPNEIEKILSYEADALFVMIGADASTSWLPGELERDPRGYICTGRDLTTWKLARAPFPLETSLPGVFCAGDVRHNSIKRVSSGVGEGSMAIAFIHQYLAL